MVEQVSSVCRENEGLIKSTEKRWSQVVEMRRGHNYRVCGRGKRAKKLLVFHDCMQD